MVFKKGRTKRKLCNLCGKGIYGKHFAYYVKTFEFDTVEYVLVCKTCVETLKKLDDLLPKKAMKLLMEIYEFSAKCLRRITPIRIVRRRKFP